MQFSYHVVNHPAFEELASSIKLMSTVTLTLESNLFVSLILRLRGLCLAIFSPPATVASFFAFLLDISPCSHGHVDRKDRHIHKQPLHTRARAVMFVLQTSHSLKTTKHKVPIVSVPSFCPQPRPWPSSFPSPSASACDGKSWREGSVAT